MKQALNLLFVLVFFFNSCTIINGNTIEAGKVTNPNIQVDIGANHNGDKLAERTITIQNGFNCPITVYRSKIFKNEFDDKLKTITRQDYYQLNRCDKGDKIEYFFTGTSICVDNQGDKTNGSFFVIGTAGYNKFSDTLVLVPANSCPL